MGNIIRAQTREALRSPTVAIEKVSVREFEQCLMAERLRAVVATADIRRARTPPGGLQKNAGARPADIGCLIDLASGPRNRRDRPTLGGTTAEKHGECNQSQKEL
jgi:hypothetical protein